MFIPHWAWPGGGLTASEVVTAREQFEEKPIVLGDGVGVVEDGSPPVEGVEDDVFAERGESEGRPVGAGVAAKGADVCCRTQSVSEYPTSRQSFVVEEGISHLASPPHSSVSCRQ